MMPMWLLDDGPLGWLALALDASWDWPSSTLHVVGHVASSAGRDRSGRRAKLLSMAPKGGAPSIQVHEIPVPSPAADMVFSHLRPDSSDTDEDLGEHESIALCALVEPQAIFVAADKKAAFLAMAELGGARVATPFDCWASLKDNLLISPAQFSTLCERTVKESGLPGLPRRFKPNAVT